MNEIEEKVYSVFKSGSGYARTKDIISAGIYNTYLNKLLEGGRIEKIKRGLYRWVGMNETGYQGMVDVSKAIQGGVICLISALSFYNMTTVKPMEVSIAIDRKRKVVKPHYPPTKIYYFKKDIFEAGIQKEKVGSVQILIYNKEKTLCDCIRYRNQIGMDIVKEALLEYLKNSNRNLELLMEYAEICKVKTILKNYLEVMI
ncbi:MAG: type IV toxin-antitoxin system AbiEi family antitoxin domain-containing protein [Clostridiaceae bacterium]|nr:type IV toxin-antitoxin system AbiEi family antitoxin domain-containing protein [Clostridiaceae bacterium]